MVEKTKLTKEHKLRNLLINTLIGFASNKDHLNTCVGYLKDNTFPLDFYHDPKMKGQQKDFKNKLRFHGLNKQQRYAILRKIFADSSIEYDDKEQYLKNEMEQEYSVSVDELNKIRCQACLPNNEWKAYLWDNYVNNDEFYQEEFYYSSLSFYNKADKAQCMRYADRYFEMLNFVNQKYDADYFEIFFTSLSPAFMGEKAHLEKFKDLEEHLEENRPDDIQYFSLLYNEIQKMEEVIKIKESW